MSVQPACGAPRVLLASGVWDRIARPDDVAALHRRWPGSALISVEQGHFGFRMAEACYRHLSERGLMGSMGGM
jgi:hypothetical protein